MDNDSIVKFLRCDTIRGGGERGLIAAIIQQAFRDCYARPIPAGQKPSAEAKREAHSVREEAASWLLTAGFDWAEFLDISPETFQAAIDRLVPPKLLARAREIVAEG